MQMRIVATLAVFLSACALFTGTSNPVSTEHAALPLGAPAQACSASTLSTSGYCAGPWIYNSFVQPCWISKRDPACGPLQGYEKKTVPIYPTCRTESNGVERYVNENIEYRVSGVWVEEQVCDHSRKPPCKMVNTCHIDEKCDGREVFERRVPPSYRSNASYTNVTLGPTGGSKCQGACRADIKNAPLFVSAESSACGAPIGTRQVDDTSKPLYPACRLKSHGDAPVSECGVAPGVQYSGFGMTLKELTAKTPAGVFSPNTPAPRCTSCDDYQLASAKDAPGMATCLASARKAASGLPVDRAALQSRLIEKSKLLYELYADALSADTRAEYQELYLSSPDSVPPCKTDSLVPSTPAQCTTPRPAERLRFCQRLLLGHVSTAVVATSLDVCIKNAAEIDRLASTCQPDPLRQAYIKVSSALTQRMLGTVSAEGTPALPKVDSLREKLALIEQWHQAVLPFASANSARHAEMLDAMQQLVATLWNSARAAGALAAGATRDQIAANDVEIDRRVLLAAVGGQRVAVTGAPLFHVLDRGFQQIAQRIRNVTEFSDLGCLLQGCGAGGTTSEISEIWALWSQLGNPDGTSEALKKASHVRPAWKEVFTAIDKQGPAVQGAVASAARTNEVVDLGVTDSSELFDFASPLSTLVREAAARSTSFARLGRLELHPRTVLRGGLASAQIAVLEAELNSRINSLRQAIEVFKRDERTYLSDLQNDLATGSRQVAAKQQLIDRQTQVFQLAQDLAGLRESAAIEANDFALFVDRFKEAAKKEDQAMIKTLDTQLAVAAKGARYTGDASNIAKIAVLQGGKPWSRPVAKGSMVSIRTGNEQWSPTCAVRATKIADPTGSGQAPIDVTASTTGPEGYLVQWQGNSYHATSNRTSLDISAHHSDTASTKACAGAKVTAEAPGIAKFFVPIDLEVYASIDACVGSDIGMTQSATEAVDAATGMETRQAAAFSSGLRAPGTPVPKMPAGALLAIRLPAGVTDMKKSHISVVRAPLTQFLADEDSDIYFVVNDKAGCEDVSGELAVQVTELQLTGANAGNTAAAMKDVMQNVRDQTPRFLNQGRILPNELATIREAAYQTLRTKVKTVDQLPPILRGMFDQWLDTELLKIQREVEIKGVTRSLDLLRTEAASAKEALDLVGGEQRLIHEMTRLSLNNLDSDHLGYDVGRLIEYLVQYMHPAFELRYPSVLRDMVKDHAVLDKFATLVGIDFMRSVSDLARDALTVADTIKSQWDATKLNAVASGNVGTSVAVSFPRPGAPVTSVWSKADPVRSASVWQSLLDPNQTRAGFEIEPSDLYSALGGASRLQCIEATPIIRSMALFVAIDDGAVGDALNAQNWRVPAQVDGQLLFTTAVGPKNYLLSNGDWLSETMGVLFGLSQSAVATFDRVGKSALVANGLSPFSTYWVNISALRQIPKLKDASELVLLFELERQRVAAPGVRAVFSCMAAANPISVPTARQPAVVERPKLRVLPNVTVPQRRW